MADRANKKVTKEALDRLCAELRSVELPREASDLAAARVWNRLAEGLPAACAEFRSELERWIRGERPGAARQLLLEDHLQDCVACRQAWKEMRAGKAEPAGFTDQSIWKAAEPRRRLQWKPALAGLALVAGLAILVTAVWERTWAPSGSGATVLAASGPLYRLDTPAGLTQIQGRQLAYGERVRTGPQADTLLRLADGSQVEVRGQSEFALSAARQGTTLELRRGAVIVQAARQRGGRHFYVATRNALVTVKGTVFSVSEGLRGARVAVLAGQVRVDHAGRIVVLNPGQQFESDGDLTSAPLDGAFAWSRDSRHYLALLASLSSLRHDLDQVPYPGLRYDSSLLPLVPADTVFYAALPNLSGTLARSYAVVQQHLAQDPQLRAWWQRRQGHSQDMAAAIDELQAVGADLGDEVVIAASALANQPSMPLILAQATNGEDLMARLRQRARPGAHPQLAIVADPARARSAPAADLYVWLDDGLLAASPNLAGLRQLEARLAEPRGAGFAATPFYDRIATAYQQGVSVLLAADLRPIVAQVPRRSDLAEKIGIGNLDYFVATQQISSSGASDRATLSFTDARSGIASWLAAPGPMGALAYISPHPPAVVVAEVKQPSAIIHDILTISGSNDPDFNHSIAGFDPMSLAAPLGTEFAFALDGPLLPTPAWKAIIEVNDPEALRQAIDRFVTAWNQNALAHNRPALDVGETQSGGQTYYRLSERGSAAEVDYTFNNGYVLFAPQIGLLDEALRYHDAEYDLARSPQFLAALPRDNEVNCSALFYQNLSPALQTLLSLPGAGQMTPQQQASLERLGAEAPSAACAYAGERTIRFAMKGPNAPFGLGLGTILGAPSSFDLRDLIERAIRQP